MGVRKIQRQFNITHTFADGRTLSHAELLEKGFEVNEEGNQAVFENLYRLIDPLYDKHKNYKAKVKANEKRKEELIAELKALEHFD